MNKEIVKINLFENGCYLLDIDRIGKESLPIYYNLSELIVSNDLMYILLLDNKTIGFVIFDFKDHLKTHIHIKSIAIDKNYRKKGYATELLEFLKNIYTKITLFVQKGNEEALTLYEKKKFKIISTDENYYSTLKEKCAYQMEYQKL